MAVGDLTRIGSNIQGLNILRTLRDVNNSVSTHQLRLGTGLRINSAADDPARLTISNKLEARNRILQSVYDNIGEAKNMLDVAEGGLHSMDDILVEMGSLLITAATDTLGDEERQAISQQLVQMTAEISDIATETEFNGQKLLDSATTFNFQTGPTTSITYSTASYQPTDLGLTNLVALTATDIIDSTNFQTYMDEVNAALSTINNNLTDLGSVINRMTIKEDNISTTQINTEAAMSRIRDADLAKEQLELTKFQILQQTSTAMLAQSNYNSQSLLQLFQ